MDLFGTVYAFQKSFVQFVGALQVEKGSTQIFGGSNVYHDARSVLGDAVPSQQENRLTTGLSFAGIKNSTK